MTDAIPDLNCCELYTELEVDAMFPGALDRHAERDHFPMRTSRLCGGGITRKYVVSNSGLLWAVMTFGRAKVPLYYYPPKSSLWRLYVEGKAEALRLAYGGV